MYERAGRMGVRSACCHASNPPHVVGGILCANCGGGGHTFRACDLPITSFGVVCFRRVPHHDTTTSERGVGHEGDEQEFLLVQRKDSLCYVEFIRGKYSLQNRGYVSRLLSNMTHGERTRLLTLSFDDLWCNFWKDDRSKRFMNEYNQSRTRFEALRTGFGLRTAASGEIVDVDLASLISTSAPGYEETEWGFPKGRRNIDESDIDCAMREFTEETGVLGTDVLSVRPFKAFEETFVGSNKVRYRHVYYVFEAISQDLLQGEEGSGPPRPVSIHQSREISRVAWFTRDEVLARIRVSNVERREMFNKLCNYVHTASVQKPGTQGQGRGRGARPSTI